MLKINSKEFQSKLNKQILARSEFNQTYRITEPKRLSRFMDEVYECLDSTEHASFLNTLTLTSNTSFQEKVIQHLNKFGISEFTLMKKRIELACNAHIKAKKHPHTNQLIKKQIARGYVLFDQLTNENKQRKLLETLIQATEMSPHNFFSLDTRLEKYWMI